MTKENKKLSLILMLVVLMILALFCLVDEVKKRKELNDFAKYAPILVEAPASVEAELDSARDNITTTSKSDASIKDSPVRVVIRNRDELAKAPLPDYGVSSLETYLDIYFNYYLDNGINYYAEYLPDTYISNYNLPCFTIHVEDLDMDVTCTYYAARKIYHFYSAFNPNGE